MKCSWCDATIVLDADGDWWRRAAGPEDCDQYTCAGHDNRHHEPSVVHLPPAGEIAAGRGDWVGWLTPDSELEESELGERVCDWLTHWMLAGAYCDQQSRERSAVTTLVGEVASATSWRRLPYPREWWPPSAGEVPQSAADIPHSEDR